MSSSSSKDQSSLVPLAEISDDTTFYRGARFRQYGIGLNVASREEDYYEYMIAVLPGDNENMVLTCVEGYKAGLTLALVKTHDGNSWVSGKALKFSMGIENTFYLPEG